MILPCNTIEERQSLILVQETINKLGINPNTLGRHSRKDVIIKCPVCQQVFQKELKSFLDGKGRTCPSPECKNILRCDSQGKAKSRETKEIKQQRINKVKEAWKAKTDQDIEQITAKRRATVRTERGVDWISQDPSVRAKMSTGVREAYKDPSVLEKRYETNLKLYGHTNYLASKQGQDRVRECNRGKLGVDFPFQNKEFQTKAREITQEKYNIDNVRHLPGVSEKIVQTCQEKYGVENPQQDPLIREKSEQTNIIKYGVPHLAQLPENRNRLKEWCIENPDKVFISKPELAILEWVQSFYPGAKKYKDGTHEIDIFIPDINFGIEHNGLFHHQEDVLNARHNDKVGRNYHLNKTNYFKEKDIRIVHIFEHEWRDRQEQVKSFLQSAIGKNEHRIGARKCDLIWSNNQEDIREVHTFLEQYHIQGAPGATKYIIKAIYNNELLAAATFGLHHRNSEEWVLTRFCTKQNYTIQGILSRMSKIASGKLQADIISWADYRLSAGNGYEKAGWVFEKLHRPDYFYHKSGKVFSKQSRQKQAVRTPEGMTEKEHAEQDGLHRVYDCGKIRYMYKNISL